MQPGCIMVDWFFPKFAFLTSMRLGGKVFFDYNKFVILSPIQCCQYDPGIPATMVVGLRANLVKIIFGLIRYNVWFWETYCSKIKVRFLKTRRNCLLRRRRNIAREQDPRGNKTRTWKQVAVHLFLTCVLPHAYRLYLQHRPGECLL